MKKAILFLTLQVILITTAGILYAQTEPCRAYLVGIESPRNLVGSGETLVADGAPDAHFRIHIMAPGKTLTGLEIINTSGQYSVWDTIPGNGFWVMAVVQGEKLQNDASGGIKIVLPKEEEILDLYVQDNGSIAGKGTNFKLTLMFADGSKVSIPVSRVGAVDREEAPAVQSPPGGPKVVLDNWNKEAVLNGPARATMFKIDRQTFITSIMNYHWNDGKGMEPGKIALIGQDGSIHGPWPTIGTSGTGGARNVNWVARPSVLLPPGAYTVIDSDLATWSQNAQSGGAGFSQVSAEESPATLKLDNATFAPGEEIQVFFTAPEGLPESAWIGIIPSDVEHGSEPLNDQYDITYQYFKGSSGSLTFKAPMQPGSYDFRMNEYDGGGREIAYVSFTVK
jgi:hypothetical protein